MIRLFYSISQCTLVLKIDYIVITALLISDLFICQIFGIFSHNTVIKPKVSLKKKVLDGNYLHTHAL